MKKARSPKTTRPDAATGVSSSHRAPPTTKEPPLIPKHPSITQARIDAILDDVRNGKSFSQACRDNGTSDDSWYRACDAAPFLRAATTRARELRGDRIAEEVIEVADGTGRFAGIPCDERRLMADSRKWASARMSPKRWGEKMEITTVEAPLGGSEARGAVESLLSRADELRRRIKGE